MRLGSSIQNKFRVPFLELYGFNSSQDRQVRRAVLRVTRSGSYVLGDEVRGFESRWAEYVGSEHCVSVGSGLSALELGLKVLGVGPGAEVIVPERTFIATWMAVSNVGATPVPVRTEPNGSNLDVRAVHKAITGKTRAIVPVHLYGHPVDLSGLRKISEQFGVPVLEDAAQAHGARLHGPRIGGHGNLVAWSFYPGKNLGALGDAGALTTNSEPLADEIRLLRNYGARTKYVHEKVGGNSRLDEIQAAVLTAKLPFLEAANGRRREIAESYIGALESVSNSPSIENLRRIRTMESAGSLLSSWHLFSIDLSQNREKFVAALASAGVETGSHYPVWPESQRAYGGQVDKRLKAHDSGVVSLPIGPHLSLSTSRRVAELAAAAAARLEVFVSRVV